MCDTALSMALFDANSYNVMEHGSPPKVTCEFFNVKIDTAEFTDEAGNSIYGTS